MASVFSIVAGGTVQGIYENDQSTVEATVVAFDNNTITYRTTGGSLVEAYNKNPYFVDRKMSTTDVIENIELDKTYKFDVIGWTSFIMEPNVIGVSKLKPLTFSKPNNT